MAVCGATAAYAIADAVVSDEPSPEPVPAAVEDNLPVTPPGATLQETESKGLQPVLRSEQTPEEKQASSLIHIAAASADPATLGRCSKTIEADGADYACEVLLAVGRGDIKPGDYTLDEWTQILHEQGIDPEGEL